MFVRERFHGLALFFKNSVTIFREEAISALRGFHAAPLSWSNWNLRLVFVEGEKPENEGKNHRSKVNNKFNPDMTPGRNPNQATSVGGKRSHHCFIQY